MCQIRLLTSGNFFKISVGTEAHRHAGKMCWTGYKARRAC